MTTRPAIKRLNEPQAIEVQTSPLGIPRKVRLKTIQTSDSRRKNSRISRNSRSQQFRIIRSDGQWMKVVFIEDLWKINDEWWRGEELEIERLYFNVILENSQRLTLFHDLVRDTWSRQAE